MSIFKKSAEPPKHQAMRRVVKQGAAYICGLCARRHAAQAEAESCLATCTARYLSQEATAPQGETKSKRYRCSFCKRIYDSAIIAKECAQACKITIQKRIDIEAKVQQSGSRQSEDKLKKLAQFASQSEQAGETGSTWGGGASGATGLASLKKLKSLTSALEQPAAARKAKAPSYRCDSCSKEYKSPSEAQDCFREHQNVKEVKATPAAHASTAQLPSREAAMPSQAKVKAKGEAPAEATGPSSLDLVRASRAKDADLETKFFRDGAKYVCRNCSKKYFTKDDVVSCFNGHGPEAEVYVSGSNPANSSQPSAPATSKSSASSSSAQSDKERFYRDGAKYVCKKCSAKYFTRTEVVSCFDGHS